jgi:hypothetical protein
MSSSAKYPNEVAARTEVQSTDYVLGYRPGTPSAISRWTFALIQEWIESIVGAVGGVVGRPLPTGYTGGTSTDIHSVTTADLAVGTVILMPNMPPGERQWQVIASPGAEDTSAGLVRPTDYHATTNNKGLQLF